METHAQKLTYQEIEKQFPNEWILLEDPETDPNDIKKADGIVLLHHPDKRTLHQLTHEIVKERKAKNITTPIHYAMIYTGNLNITSRPWLHATVIPGTRKII